MPSLLERLGARGLCLPSYDGDGLLNVPATVLELLGLRDASDPLPLCDLDQALMRDVRTVVVVLVDGLGTAQLDRLCAAGQVPFLASIVERAGRRDGAQRLDLTTVFPSTTAAALTTLHTARTPQEHGNLAYFLWLDEFAQLTQMLRWGPAASRRGSFFDDASVDPRAYVHATSLHRRIRDAGLTSYVIEPEIFRHEAMTRMHAAEARIPGYVLPSTLAVRLRDALADAADHASAYVYAYWAGVDTAGHLYGPTSAEHDAEAALCDLTLRRALDGLDAPGTLVLLTADHGHAAIDPSRLIDLEADAELRAMLRHPLSGEPRLVFLHTGAADRVVAYLETSYPDTFFCFTRDEAIAAGLFGRGDASLAHRRVGEVCAMLDGDRGAGLVRIDGKLPFHRGAHGGMTEAEMRIPLLAWRM
jgi:hypothetical protein